MTADGLLLTALGRSAMVRQSHVLPAEPLRWALDDDLDDKLWRLSSRKHSWWLQLTHHLDALYLQRGF